ncbi:MAG: DUF2156 domain-containing protein [Spirochaetales bacterium]|nr:MAG: DUF2156 domain-containing protein [Spirochaetales bacterium]
MIIPAYPEFADISMDMRPILHPRMVMLKDGVSEFSFAGLYLFRKTYQYRLSWLPDETIIISGMKAGKRVFMLPCGFPQDVELIKDFFARHDYCRCLSATDTHAARISLESLGFVVEEDRDHFDYLYLRKELASLEGREYHKKRNLINAFINNYTYAEKPLTEENMGDAQAVLEEWTAIKGVSGDYTAANEALQLAQILELSGSVYYVDGTPAGYTLGEPVKHGRSFAVHFEKANSKYKGIYQFMNQSFAASLPRYITWINREQDLGDPGLRQAKMTYRPADFVKKYRILKPEEEPAPPPASIS